MTGGVQLLCAVAFFCVGLSHLAQPVPWAQFFIDLRKLGTTGIFCTALLGLPIGVLIISFHNLWSWPPVLLTVIGWGFVTKAALYLIAPKVGMKTLQRISTDKAGRFRIAGAGLLALSGYCFALRFVWS